MRIGNKKLGLSKQLENNCLHHNITIRYNPKTDKTTQAVVKPVKAIVKPVVDVVENVVRETVKGVQNVGNEIAKTDQTLFNNTFTNISREVGNATPEIRIAKEDMSIKGAGKLVGNGFSVAWRAIPDTLSFLDREALNGNLNLYTGGLIDSLKNFADFPKELMDGQGVEDNLVDIGRVALIAAAIYFTGGTYAAVMAGYTTTLGTAGMTSFGDLAKAGIDAYAPPGFGDLAQRIIDGPKQIVDYVTTYTPSDAGNPIVLQDVVDSKVVFIIVGTVLVATSIVILKKKKIV